MTTDANDPNDFYNLTVEEQETLKIWIKKTFTPRKTLNKDMSSYGLKHIFEKYDKGFYIHNGQFKGAMLECGFEGVPCSSGSINCFYRFSSKSLCRSKNGQYFPHWGKDTEYGRYTE